MADIYGSHFEYGGISSRDYGLILSNIETERFRNLSGQIEGVTIFNHGSKQRYLINNNYTESPITFDVDINTEDDRCLNKYEMREIEKWLFNRCIYKRFYVDTADDTTGETFEIIDGIPVRYYLNCHFINAEKLEYNGGVVGYKATLEADSCMWWQEQTEQEFTINNSTDASITNIEVNVDTDIDDYTYPVVIITMKQNTGGNITLVNTSDITTRLTQFEDIPAGSTLVINSVINSALIGNISVYENMVDPNFPRLVDGKNTIGVMGVGIDSIKYRIQNRRFL